MKCGICKGYSLVPDLTSNAIGELYSVAYTNSHLPKANDEQNRKSYHEKFKFALQYLPDKPILGRRLLDFGCGISSPILDEGNARGFEVWGSEYDEEVLNICRQKTQYNFESSFTLLNSDKKFAIIFLGDVLEHIPDLSSKYEQLLNLLEPGGFMIIQGPLEGTFSLTNLMVSIKAFFIRRPTEDIKPFHVTLATLKSMEKLFESNHQKIKFRKVTEVTWPSVDLKHALQAKNWRLTLKATIKLVDKVVAFFIPRYGNRFLFVVEKSRNFRAS